MVSEIRESLTVAIAEYHAPHAIDRDDGEQRDGNQK